MRLVFVVTIHDEEYVGTATLLEAEVQQARVKPMKPPKRWPVPAPHLLRDACTCSAASSLAHQHTLRLHKSAHERLCVACQAWEEGYVLIDGERKYLRSMWVTVNREAAQEVEI